VTPLASLLWHVIDRFFLWKHFCVHRVRALEHTVRVLEMERSCIKVFIFLTTFRLK